MDDHGHDIWTRIRKGEVVNRREKEAPKVIKLITGNVWSLACRAQRVAKWDADIVALQETKLTAAAIAEVRPVFTEEKEEGWQDSES